VASSSDRQPRTSPLEKLACGRFSDIGSVAAGKKRGFCRLRRRRGERMCKSDRLLVHWKNWPQSLRQAPGPVLR
jgi:hypothetical protein